MAVDAAAAAASAAAENGNCDGEEGDSVRIRADVGQVSPGCAAFAVSRRWWRLLGCGKQLPAHTGRPCIGISAADSDSGKKSLSPLQHCVCGVCCASQFSGVVWPL